MSDLVTIDLLGPDETPDDLAHPISEAFVNYPVMRKAFADAPGDRKDWIFKLAQLSAKGRQDAGRPTPVARANGRIVGAVNVLFANQEDKSSQNAWFDDFLAKAGPTAQNFFPRFIEATKTISLPEPHTYLIMIGVHPEYQGQGVGRRLIEYVVETSRTIPGCKGVALDTEEEVNVKIYEACGFVVQGQTFVDDLPIWVMWKSFDLV